jgi:hypothetical protein
MPGGTGGRRLLKSSAHVDAATSAFAASADKAHE